MSHIEGSNANQEAKFDEIFVNSSCKLGFYRAKLALQRFTLDESIRT